MKAVEVMKATGQMVGRLGILQGGSTSPPKPVADRLASTPPRAGQPALPPPLAQDIKNAMQEVIDRLVREGKRLPGQGVVKGVFNNALGNNRCFEQAEILQKELQDRFGEGGRRGYSFRIGTYAGEGHEANGHYWGNAIPADRSPTILILGPWANTVTTAPNYGANPVVIKGRPAWAWEALLHLIGGE
ncbi:MAG: hypothetical protein OZSIB_0759 [Candidatus Ozemobacter sibiricus]|uniref:Uncharacterized protein n=1 Tax=Candidatus Ozemobacter sibiricus TaxID=2268124 RepID=A0A367ZTZ7_9BACT|nr:MAG: hypothetical protein OZSIB_0759 [Candidatus Ozemobacter sibiricus]